MRLPSFLGLGEICPEGLVLYGGGPAAVVAGGLCAFLELAGLGKLTVGTGVLLLAPPEGVGVDVPTGDLLADLGEDGLNM